MVGATTTFCGAASRMRFLKYSAIRKSLFSWRWRPCSLDSAPRAIITTVSGVRIFSASSHDKVSRRTAGSACSDGGGGAAGDWPDDRVAPKNENKKQTVERSANSSRCLKASTKAISAPRQYCLKGRDELRPYNPLVEVIER